MRNLFCNGDPRFLAGAKTGPTCHTTDYSSAPDIIRDGDETDTAEDVALRCLSRPAYPENVLSEVIAEKQNVHFGKHHYHGRPNTNTFLTDNDPYPTAGVELETIIHGDLSDTDLTADLVSNWFHFERDGSLGDPGYECITEPLPSSVYRDIRLWLGLQNALTPWTESWHTSATGLHVHVGVNRFRYHVKNHDRITGCPVTLSETTTVNLARHILTAVYYTLIPESLKRAVFMRKGTSYCANPLGPIPAMRLQTILSADPMSDTFVNHLLMTHLSDTYAVINGIQKAFPNRQIALTDPAYDFIDTKPTEMSGHSAELNMDHGYTIEFRRGKGTLNGVTVHRMVEFTTLLVRFVEHVMYSPAFPVSQDSLYTFIRENTTSDALKALVTQEKGNTECAS